MNVLKLKSSARLWVPALVAAAALPLAAGITVNQYASPYVAYTSYVDFAASSLVAGHQNYSTFIAAQHPRGMAVKYFDIAVDAHNQFAPVGRCYEVSTSAPSAGIVSDTEILVKATAASTSWLRLSDDYAGTRFSKARFWFGEDFVDGTTVFLRVAPYSDNSIHFKFTSQLVRQSAAPYGPIATEAECFSDPNIAAAFVDRHENVFIRRAI
jgi:hypothetical protein